MGLYRKGVGAGNWVVIKVIKGNYHQIRLVIGAIHNQQEPLCTHMGNIPKRREETKRRPFVQNEK